MPARTKPPRLYLEPARRNKAGKITHQASWVITHGDKKRRTGFGEGDRQKAEEALADYLIELREAARLQALPGQNLPAHEVMVADVLATYAEHKTVAKPGSTAKLVKRPDELLSRVGKLLDFWGDKTLADITRYTCQAYAAQRSTENAARRELEDLRAAIGLAHEDGVCRQQIVVKLPNKPPSRMAYFTRKQIADMVRYCYRHRVEQRIPRGPRKGEKVRTRHRSMRHLVPFILTAVYTGSRSWRIWNASFEREIGLPWIDLEEGVFYRLYDGEIETTKRAGSLRLPGRLLAHMRRWHAGPIIDGQRRPQKYLVEWQGRPADPKLALGRVMKSLFGEDHEYVRHTFRHTCVTWLCWAQVPMAEIADYVSMTEEMVTKVYKHAHPDTHRDAGDAITTGRVGRKRGTHRDDKPVRSAEKSRRNAEETGGMGGNEAGIQ